MRQSWNDAAGPDMVRRRNTGAFPAKSSDASLVLTQDISHNSATSHTNVPFRASGLALLVMHPTFWAQCCRPRCRRRGAYEDGCSFSTIPNLGTHQQNEGYFTLSIMTR